MTSPKRTRWSVEESILVADWVWTHKARAKGAELTALRAEVIAAGAPRSEDAIDMQAFEFAAEWGYAQWTGREQTVQISAVATLFKAFPHDMHRLARTIALLTELGEIRAGN